jgi:hypothetical protein
MVLSLNSVGSLLNGRVLQRRLLILSLATDLIKFVFHSKLYYPNAPGNRLISKVGATKNVEQKARRPHIEHTLMVDSII